MVIRSYTKKVIISSFFKFYSCGCAELPSPAHPMMKSSPFLNLLLILLFAIENLSNDVFLIQQFYPPNFGPLCFDVPLFLSVLTDSRRHISFCRRGIVESSPSACHEVARDSE